MTDEQARDLLLDLAYQTDEQVLGLARNIIGPDCTSLPGTGWDGDSLTLTNRREFVTWLVLRNNAAAPPHALVDKIMKGAGYEAWSTGGGCMAWGKTLQDGTHVLISADNRLHEDPNATDWSIGRYTDADDNSFDEINDFVTLYDALVLEQILASKPKPTDQTRILLDDIEEDLLAQRWTNRLGLFFNLDKDGREYSPRLSAEEIAAYDNDVHVLCRVSADPQDAVLRAQKRAGLLDAYEPSYITLEQFRASRIRVADLKLYLAEDVLEDEAGPVPGYLYLGCTYITDAGDGDYSLVISNCGWASKDLGELEQRLYEWCRDEQIKAVEV